MIEFKRYPHVRDIIEYYAIKLNNESIIDLLNLGVGTEDEAYRFSRFVLVVIDNIGSDMNSNNNVLGSKDNTAMIPDIDYEVSLYLANRGFEHVWDEVCDEG